MVSPAGWTDRRPTPPHHTYTGPIPTCHAPLIAPPRGAITGSSSPVNNAPYCVGCRAHVLREGEALPPPPEPTAAAVAAVEGGDEGKVEAEVASGEEEEAGEGVQVRWAVGSDTFVLERCELTLTDGALICRRICEHTSRPSTRRRRGGGRSRRGRRPRCSWGSAFKSYHSHRIGIVWPCWQSRTHPCTPPVPLNPPPPPINPPQTTKQTGTSSRGGRCAPRAAPRATCRSCR